MSVKILMTWDILPGREQDYFEFVVRDFIPGLQEMGLQPSGGYLAWILHWLVPGLGVALALVREWWCC